jgi:titin
VTATDADTEVTLTARTTKPTKLVRWYKNGREIRPDGVKYIENIDGTTVTLTIRNPENSDAAEYKLELPSSDETTTGKVHVHLSPKIQLEEKFKVNKADKNDTIKLVAKVTGAPTPTVRVLKEDGTPIEKVLTGDVSRRLKINLDETVLTFVLDKCMGEDSNQYTIEAKNEYGTARQPFDVHIRDVPSPVRALNITDVDKESVTLAWTPPASDGGSEITGYSVEKRTAGSTRWSPCGKVEAAKLNFMAKDLIEGESYQFQVCAVNQIGQSRPVETVDVIAKAKFNKPGTCDAPNVSDVTVCAFRNIETNINTGDICQSILDAAIVRRWFTDNWIHC